MKDLVSVIIPTYKRSSCLIRAINSVINQTYKNIEIIVVDDNDETSMYRKENEKKLEKFINDKKIIYLKHKNNLNGASARNTGIKQARGSYITFLDDDDYFATTRIEKLVDLLNNNKEYDGAYSSVIFEDKDGNIVNVLHANLKGNLQDFVLSGKSFFGTGSNMFFRKNVIDKIGFFDKDFRRHQDFEYMVRFFEFSKIINIDEFLVVKSNFDNINKPSYQLYYDSKDKFLKKFEAIISKKNDQIKRKIYINQFYDLYNYAPKEEKKAIKIKLEEMNERKRTIYLTTLKMSIKKKLKQVKIVRSFFSKVVVGRHNKTLLEKIREPYN